MDATIVQLPNLKEQIIRVEAGKALLDVLRPLPAAVVDELKHLFEVRLTHHSTAIEGNTLTQSETEIVIDKGVTIAGKSVREHLEVIGHKEALGFVYELAVANSDLGERQVREIHSLVMKGDDDAERGGYRTLDVRAAGTEFVYPSHLKVPELMGEFVHWVKSSAGGQPVRRASEAHLRFVTIHPFRDGNGRVGRLLLNLLLLKSGYPIAVIPVFRRSVYIDSLVTAQSTGDRTALDGLVLDAVESSLRDILEVALGSEGTKRDHAEAIQEWLTEAQRNKS